MINKARLFTWLAGLLVASSALAQPAEPAQPGPRWAHITKLVLPEYPEDAIREGRSGVVDIVGIIGGGKLVKAIYIPSAPGADDFVAAVKLVVPKWDLQPEAANACIPARKASRVRAEFTLENGTPRVAVSHAGKEAEAQAEDGLEVVAFRGRSLNGPTRQVWPAYPRAPLRDGIEAKVFSHMRVDGEGRVQEVRALAYPPDVFDSEVLPAGTPLPEQVTLAPDENLAAFVRETIRAHSRWTFPEFVASHPKGFIICHETTFRLK